MPKRSCARGEVPSGPRAGRPAWRGLALAALLVTVVAPRADAFVLVLLTRRPRGRGKP